MYEMEEKARGAGGGLGIDANGMLVWHSSHIVAM